MDQADKVVELSGVPQSCAGAPRPVVISNEHVLLLAYDVQDEPMILQSKVLTDGDVAAMTELVAVIQFRSYHSYTFGAPNDEALHGHPLYDRGLRSYGAFEIKESSWVSEMEKRNSIHPRHQPEWSKTLHHYVFTFHDSTFECLAAGFEVTEHKQSIQALLPALTLRLFTNAAI